MIPTETFPTFSLFSVSALVRQSTIAEKMAEQQMQMQQQVRFPGVDNLSRS